MASLYYISYCHLIKHLFHWFNEKLLYHFQLRGHDGRSELTFLCLHV